MGLHQWFCCYRSFSTQEKENLHLKQNRKHKSLVVCSEGLRPCEPRVLHRVLRWLVQAVHLGCSPPGTL